MRYFDPGSQAALRRILPDWARAQKSIVGQCEQHKVDVKKYQYYPQPQLTAYASELVPNTTVFSRTSLLLLAKCSVLQSQPIKASQYPVLIQRAKI